MRSVGEVVCRGVRVVINRKRGGRVVLTSPTSFPRSQSTCRRSLGRAFSIRVIDFGNSFEARMSWRGKNVMSALVALIASTGRAGGANMLYLIAAWHWRRSFRNRLSVYRLPSRNPGAAGVCWAEQERIS